MKATGPILALWILATSLNVARGGDSESSAGSGRDAMSSDQHHNRGGRDSFHKRRGAFGRKRFSRFPRLREVMESLSDEERKRLRELHREDQATFRAELRKLFKKAKRQNREEHEELRTLRRGHHDADTPERKAEIEAKIRKVTVARFNRKMAANKKRLAELEEKLETLKRQFEQREKNADAIIDARVKEIVRDPDHDGATPQ